MELRNFSAHNRGSKRQNQWLHTGYDRRRHSDVNRSTGRFFFAMTTMASAISIFVMGNLKSEIELKALRSGKEEKK
ncbi:unnamed protein product [Pseudo-nitzschia multistriata]|uniref:Uncharacterized protein n=1 Tax=Pseudo-nitzschia multistriata TaxID=183589 RepID=A0A448ZFY2_9STRA|nr:unnamed protein product [Pseudo-nitzschia multistriata]